MKRNILQLGVFFLLVVLLMSCSKCDVNIVNSSEVNEYDILSVKLDSLDNNYCAKCIIMNSQKRASDEDETTLRKKDKIDIAEADMAGFVAGGSLGGFIGGAAGTIITGGSLIGTSVGGLIGVGILGIPYSVVYSLSEYLDITSDDSTSVSSVGNFYRINPSDPIYENRYIPQFDSTISYSNVGCLHNYVIDKLIQQYDYADLMNMSYDDMLDCSINILRDSLLYNTEECDSIYSFARSEFSGINNSSVLDGYSPSDDNVYGIILRYLETVMDIQEEDLLGYTSDFMSVVSQELTNLDEVFIVNASISVFYYSYILWKVEVSNNIPNIYIIAEDNSYYLDVHCYEYLDDADYNSLLLTDDKLVFVPNFEDGVSTKLFLYNAMEQLQNSSFNGLFIVEDKYFIRVDTDLLLDVECGSESGTIFISAGIYELLHIGNETMCVELNNPLVMDAKGKNHLPLSQ